MATLNSQLANLKPFNGTNFSNWEFRLKIFLEQHNALNVLEQNAPTGEQQLQQFKKDDAKARNIMVQWLADDVLEMVKDKKTAKDMFETLKYTYTRRGLSMQVDLQRKLRNMKYKEGNLSDFFLEFDKIVSDLKASGGNLEEPEIICQLLAAMPENYQALTTSIDLMFSTNPKDVTVQFVKNKLLQEEIRQGNNGDQQKESVAFTSKYRGNGNRGNFQKRGNRQIRGQEKPKFNFKCYKCGKHGHKRNECRSSANVANGEDSRDEEISFIANKNDRTVTDETLMFIIDSGATNHLVNKQTKVYLSNIKPVSCQINVAKKGSVVNVTRSGNLHVTDKNGRNFNLKDVLQSDDLEYNLLSVKRIEKEGFKVIFEDGKVRICRKGNDTIVLEGNLKGNLYVVCFNPRFDCLNIAVDQDLLHRRMGHSSKYPPTSLCEVCLKAKQTRTHFKSMTDERKPKRVLEVISSDVCGPISPQTRDNMKYYVSFVDHYTHFSQVYLMKNKSEVLEKFKEYEAQVSSRFNRKISRIRCDNGGEYSSETFKAFCNQKGIQIEYTIPRNPEQNGIAERFNRTILEMSRCLIFESKLDKIFWGDALLTSVYLLNRLESSTIPKNTTPASMWYGYNPDLNKIRVFGCVAYAHIPKENRIGKLDSHSKKTILIGYCNNGYKLYDMEENSVVVARSVVFNEEKELTDQNDKTIRILEDNDECEVEDNKKTLNSNIETEELGIGRGKRNKRLPARLLDYDLDDETELLAALSVGYLPGEVPTSYEEAVSIGGGWKEAIQEELKNIEEQQTWELVDPPSNVKVIDSKWVFREKEVDGKVVKKARLVARGFLQSLKNEDVYSPVARMVTIRMLLVLSLEQDLHILQMDVKSAFLNGMLKSPVYMHQPPGFKNENNNNLVCKLNKALYGLKEAPKCWNDTFHDKIITLGFQRSKKDPCLYFKPQGIYLLLYVDDLIIFAKYEEDINYIKHKLSEIFKMTEMKNESLTFLGLEISKFRNELFISQTKLIDKVLIRFNMNDCKGSDIPMQPKLYLASDDKCSENLPYRELIGCLMYVMLGSRPDLCYSISYFSQFQNAHGKDHWHYLKNVLKYLNRTRNFGLKFVKENKSDIQIHTFVDSDYANDPNDRKSITGFLIKMNNNTILWKTKKQNLVALSSTESEYVALCSSIMESLFINQILLEIFVKNKPIVVHEDNQSCIRIASTLEMNRSKHIDVKYHFIRDCIAQNKVKLEYIPSEDQQADVLTKALPRVKFCYFRNLLNVTEL